MTYPDMIDYINRHIESDFKVTTGADHKRRQWAFFRMLTLLERLKVLDIETENSLSRFRVNILLQDDLHRMSELVDAWSSLVNHPTSTTKVDSVQSNRVQECNAPLPTSKKTDVKKSNK